MATARNRDRRERQLCEFAAACADALLSVEPVAPQALAEAGREAAPRLSAEVDAALRQRAGACGANCGPSAARNWPGTRSSP